jgi:hypothetical protein
LRKEESTSKKTAQDVGFHVKPRLIALSTREQKGGEERRNARNTVWKFGTGNRKCRWNARVYPERENEVILPLLPLELWAPCKACWVLAGTVIYASDTFSLPFAKASAATLPQQDKGNSVDVQRER